MKKTVCVLLTILLAIGMASCSSSEEPTPSPTPSATAQAIVTFSDPVLEAMVRGSMGKPQGSITVSEAGAVTRLNLSNEWQRYLSGDAVIRDIGGLEFFTSLESLDLSYNQITDITPLSGLTKLTSLSLNGNPVSDITPLSGLTGLKLLTLSGCAAQDYSPLEKLASLNLLMLTDSTLTDVSPLVSLTSLKCLYLAGSQVSNYFPLLDIYQSLEQKDFIIASTLSELGFVMHDDNKQAWYEGDNASVRINHTEWGTPPESWTENCIRTVFSQNDYKIDIGYYPLHDAYVVMASNAGGLALNYVYYCASDSFTFSTEDRQSFEETVRAIFTVTGDGDVLQVPIETFQGILKELLGISAETLFTMPFDEADNTLPSAYERLGFTFLEYKGTYQYEEQAPHALSLSIHKTAWDADAPVENRVDWNLEFTDSDMNGYTLQILYYADQGKYHISLQKDGTEAALETWPATGEHGSESPSPEAAQQIFAQAFGVKTSEVYDKPLAYLEQAVQERFGMSLEELYALQPG